MVGPTSTALYVRLSKLLNLVQLTTVYVDHSINDRDWYSSQERVYLYYKNDKERMMKFISWNVNGFRAVLKKNFEDFFKEADADFFCIQETKMQEGQADFEPEGYHSFYHSADKKGYSGTAIFTKHMPLAVFTGMDDCHLDEGRVLTLEYPEFYLVNCYIPNAQPGLKRRVIRPDIRPPSAIALFQTQRFNRAVTCINQPVRCAHRH